MYRFKKKIFFIYLKIFFFFKYKIWKKNFKREKKGIDTYRNEQIAE